MPTFEIDIIHAWEVTPEGKKTIPIKDITPEEWKQVKEQHAIAKKEVPTWAMFGGVINLGNRHFQVM